MGGIIGDIIPVSNFISGTAQGQLFFWDATTGKLTPASTGEMLWDDANKRLGIGTPTPGVKLDINNAGAKTAAIRFPNGGFFETGAVNDGPPSGSDMTGAKLVFYNSGNSASSYAIGEEAGAMWFNVINNSSSFKWYNSGNQKMVLDGAGSLGIGTTTPREKLDVGGYAVSNPYIVSTSDATLTQIAAVAVAEGEVISIEVDLTGRKADGTDRALYKLSGLFYRNASGNVTLEGSVVSLNTIESDATWNAGNEVLVADTGNQTVDIIVKGLAGTDIDWQAVIKYHILVAP